MQPGVHRVAAWSAQGCSLRLGPHVGWLDVTVQEAACVCVAQRAKHVREVARRGRLRQHARRLCVDVRVQVGTLEAFLCVGRVCTWTR